MMIMMRRRRRRRRCHESHLEYSKGKTKDSNGLIPPCLLQIGNPRIVEKDIILGGGDGGDGSTCIPSLDIVPVVLVLVVQRDGLSPTKTSRGKESVWIYVRIVGDGCDGCVCLCLQRTR